MSDGDHFDIVRAHVVHDLAHFFIGFAQAYHNAGFGGNVGHHGFIAAQKLERMLVIGAGTGFFIQARVGFEVVVHHVGRGLGENFQRDIETAAKVGHENFDFGLRAFFANGADAVGKVLGTAVAQVVAVHRGDHHITQLHGGHGFGEVFRLVGVKRVGAAVADVAKGAAAGADVAHNHKGGGAFAEAFADIGAAGFFAHGVHFLVAQNIFDFKKFLACGQLGAYPFGLFDFFVERHHFDGDARGFVGTFEFDALLGVDFDFAHDRESFNASCVFRWPVSLAATSAKPGQGLSKSAIWVISMPA